MRLTITTFLALCAFSPLAHAATTPQLLGESALERAAAKYAVPPESRVEGHQEA